MPNEAPFDPCRQWLGIDAVDLGDARLVLGVTERESDPLVVIRAADARLNLLRAIAPGPFELARTSLLKRVEEAREKVLAEIAAGPARPSVPPGGFAMPAPPGQRTAPAAQPPFPAAPPPQPAAPFHPAPPPPVPAPPPWPGGAGDDGIRIRTTVYRKKTPVAGIALALLALAALAGGLAYFKFVHKKPGTVARWGQGKDSRRGAAKQQEKNFGETSPEQQERDRERRREEEDLERLERETREREEKRRLAREELERQQRGREQEENKKGSGRDERRMNDGEQASSAKSEQDEAAADESQASQPAAGGDTQLDETLAAVYASMRSPDGRPDHPGIEKLLETASGQAGAAEARTRVARWRSLATFQKGFLDYRDRALAAVKAGDEYDVKDRKIAVVEVDDEIFKYHENGRNKTVSRAALPAGIALAIVTSWFDAKPANDLYLGAYHFAKQEPNAKLAREHWEKAEAGGADASSLLPLLDDPVFTRATAGE